MCSSDLKRHFFERALKHTMPGATLKSLKLLPDDMLDVTEEIDIYCDIHEEMVATILVLPNQAFTVTGPDGKFTLRGVPSGRHSLFAWSRRSEPQRVEVEIKPGETAAVALELAETKFDTKHVGKYGQAYRKLPGYP